MSYSWQPQTVAHQAPLSLGLSPKKYWAKLPFSPPGDLPDPGIKLVFLAAPALGGRFFTSDPWILGRPNLIKEAVGKSSHCFVQRNLSLLLCNILNKHICKFWGRYSSYHPAMEEKSTRGRRGKESLGWDTSLSPLIACLYKDAWKCHFEQMGHQCLYMHLSAYAVVSQHLISC